MTNEDIKNFRHGWDKGLKGKVLNVQQINEKRGWNEAIDKAIAVVYSRATFVTATDIEKALLKLKVK